MCIIPTQSIHKASFSTAGCFSTILSDRPLKAKEKNTDLENIAGEKNE